MNDATSLAVFPEELWVLILDTLDDSRDIQNVFLAFPELCILLHEKKATWLIDQVFPYIFKYCYGSSLKKTVLACRLVCRRWASAIANFLENHPSRRPYNHNGINRRTVPYGEFNYMEDNLNLVFLFYEQNILKCYNEMVSHPRNPFFCGRVNLTNCGGPTSRESFLDSSVLFLERFGQNIYDLELGFGEFSPGNIQDGERIFGKILQCLSHAPNLMNLKVGFSLGDEHMFRNIMNGNHPEFPCLQLLECLDVSYEERDSHHIARALEAAYCTANSNRVKKLSTVMLYRVLENSSYVNLLELRFQIGSFFGPSWQKFLNKRNSPLLKKLTVAGVSSQSPIYITYLFAALANLVIEELQILDCYLYEDENVLVPAVSSIKYFRFSDDRECNFDFVKTLTGVTHLHIDWHVGCNAQNMRLNDIRRECENETEFSSIVRKYAYGSYEDYKNLNIWNDLPGLKLLTVVKDNDRGLVQFSRECGNDSFYLKY